MTWQTFVVLCLAIATAFVFSLVLLTWPTDRQGRHRR